MQFAAQNPAEYGVDGAIKMWRAVVDSGDGQPTDRPLDDVRQTQGTPAQGGVLQGQAPDVPKTDAESMWESITKAGSRTNVL